MPAAFDRTTRALAHDGARGAWLAWALAALAGGVWLGWFCLARVTLVEATPHARLELRSAAHPVQAPLAGRVRTSRLALGATVQAGDVLVEMDAAEPAQRLREAQARHNALAPQLQALQQELAAQQQAAARHRQADDAAAQAAQARVAEATTGQRFAADQARRLADDARAGGVAAAEAQRAAAEAQRLAAGRDALIADAQAQQAQALTRAAQQQALIDGLQRQLAALNGDLDAGSATLARLDAEVERLRIRAPVAGRIGALGAGGALRPGEVLAAGQLLAQLLPEDELRIVAEFAPASALGRLRPGQTARLQLDGFPWSRHGHVAARVRQVAGEVQGAEGQGAARLRVELQPLPPYPQGVVLQHGLTGRLEVSVETLSPAALLRRSVGPWLTTAGEASAASAR